MYDKHNNGLEKCPSDSLLTEATQIKSLSQVFRTKNGIKILFEKRQKSNLVLYIMISVATNSL